MPFAKFNLLQSWMQSAEGRFYFCLSAWCGLSMQSLTLHQETRERWTEVVNVTSYVYSVTFTWVAFSGNNALLRVALLHYATQALAFLI